MSLARLSGTRANAHMRKLPNRVIEGAQVANLPTRGRSATRGSAFDSWRLNEHDAIENQVDISSNDQVTWEQLEQKVEKGRCATWRRSACTLCGYTRWPPGTLGV